MLLRRVIEHVREQNWIAIGIDFAIVVVGVYLGIQVSNWNAERENRQRGVEFGARLRADLREESWLHQFMYEYYRDVLASAERTVDALAGKAPLSNHDFLVNAYRATQYRSGARTRSTYDELISTGSLGLIKDQKLLDIAARTYRISTLENLVRESVESPYRQAFRMGIPNDVQRELVRRCGDRYIKPGDYQGIAEVQGYPCTLELPIDVIDPAATSLRSDAMMIRMLRLRIADLETRLGDLTERNRDVFRGLQDIATEDR